MSTPANQKKINDLEKRIKDLQKVYKTDVRESFREATQTQELIFQYQGQLENLRSKSNRSDNLKGFFTLRTESGNTQKFFIVDSNPDPSNGKITANSPLGQKLLATKVGDTLQIGEEEYRVV